MIDGCTIVIEVRRGQAYRASRIEAIKAPEVDAIAWPARSIAWS
jgi:hypothetical protein